MMFGSNRYSQTIAVALLCVGAAVAGPTVTPIWQFKGNARPPANLVYNGGNLFGVGSDGAYGLGAIAELVPPARGSASWTANTIYSPGNEYIGPLAFGPDGSIYFAGLVCGPPSQASIFQLAPPAAPGGSWTPTVLYTFSYPSLGYCPAPEVALAYANGALLGIAGGTTDEILGMVFELTPAPTAGAAWNLTTLYTFSGGSDGGYPYPQIVLDSSGAVYGTTVYGGSAPYPQGDGTVFMLTPPAQAGDEWTESTLYTFAGGSDGGSPGKIAFGPNGAIYGVTYYGGTACAYGDSGCGTVFQLLPPGDPGGAWTESILYASPGEQGQEFPNGLVVAPNGALYATDEDDLFQLAQTGGVWTETLIADHTQIGMPTGLALLPDGKPVVSGWTVGTCSCYAGVFRASQASTGGSWKIKSIFSPAAENDGSEPVGPLAFDSRGAVYGTTLGGGSATVGGTVFRLTPPQTTSQPWTEALLYSFQGGDDGSQPCCGVVIAGNGALYGTTAGGRLGGGTVFELTPPEEPGGAWTKTTIHSLTGTAEPTSPLVVDGSGALYGATNEKVFQLMPPAAPGGKWKEAVLTASHGANELVFWDGVLYGAEGASVFQLTAPAAPGDKWAETILHTFMHHRASPSGPFVFDSSGNLYGTAVLGGGGCGDVYQLAPGTTGTHWQETILYAFGGAPYCDSESYPTGLALLNGNFYGARGGGLFEVRGSDWSEHDFGQIGGALQGLYANQGALYGTASNNDQIYQITF